MQITWHASQGFTVMKVFIYIYILKFLYMYISMSKLALIFFFLIMTPENSYTLSKII